MKKIRKLFMIGILFFLCPVFVKAGSISFTDSRKISENVYQFDLKATDMDFNFISGEIKITNGFISNIKMQNGWISKTGNKNVFYFYRNGTLEGSYLLATIEITITGNSNYTMNNLNYGLNKCKKDAYGTYFGENGKIVSKQEYENTCEKSNDAYLKSLSLEKGKLTNTFKKELEIYGAEIPDDVDTVKFITQTNHNKAKVISGQTCHLKTGLNSCQIVVQAERGNTKTYTVTIVKENKGPILPPNVSGDITNFKVHNGTLNQPFDQNKKEYEIKVDKGANSIYFTFLTNKGLESHKSNACNAYADYCYLTVSLENGAKEVTYTFKLIGENNSNQNTGNTNNQTPNNSSNNKKPDSNSSNGNSNNNTNSTPNQPNINNDTNSNNKPEDNNINEGENSCTKPNEKEEISSNNNQQEKEEKIVIPFMNKEISKKTVFLIVGGLIFAVGIIVGKFFKKWKKEVIAPVSLSQEPKQKTKVGQKKKRK